MLERLKEGGSTQANESLHNIHTSFGGKRIFWGRSSSAKDSWGATVLRKNEGRSFTKFIYDELDISVGKHQQIYLDKWDKEEQYHSKWKKQPKIINKRKKSKDERSAESKVKNKQEGIQYQTGIGVEGFANKNKRKTLQDIPENKWLYCKEQGCTKVYVTQSGLNTHLKQHSSMQKQLF
jgi:hypothetical protein